MNDRRTQRACGLLICDQYTSAH